MRSSFVDQVRLCLSSLPSMRNLSLLVGVPSHSESECHQLACALAERVPLLETLAIGGHGISSRSLAVIATLRKLYSLMIVYGTMDEAHGMLWLSRARRVRALCERALRAAGSDGPCCV